MLRATAATKTAFRGVALAPEQAVTVTPSAGANGTISPSVPTQYQLGLSPVFTATPDPTYSALFGGTCGGSAVGNSYTVAALTADCTVTVSFTIATTFTVTPSANAGGTISPSTAQTILQGATTTFTVTPNAGFTALVGGTCGGSLAGTTYTTDAINADCTVAATFTPITYNVTPSAGANGTISPSLVQTINSGSTTIFVVTPDSGFSTTVGGTCGGSLVGTTYTTNAITANCTVDATFAPLPTYSVTPSASANGTITPATAQTIVSGNTTSFTVTPDAGYSVAMRGTCGGNLLGTTFTTNPITASCTVTATFAKKVVLFLGNSYTFGRIDPVMSYNTANVTDLTYAMWVANDTGTNVDEPHPWGGIPGVFKKMTDQAGLDYDVSISARNAASLRGHYLNSNPAGWDLRGNAASQKWNAIVLQDLSDEPLPAGRSSNANLPYFNTYADKFESWVHTGAAETYTETALFGGGDANVCATVTGASVGTCNTVRTISPANTNASVGTDVFLYQTWARPDLIAPNGTNVNGTTYSAIEGLEAMTADFHNSYFGRAAANANYKAVNPVGDAFLLAVTSGIAMRDPYAPEPGKINLWHTDFFHPSKHGSYLSALVHFAMISGIDPVTLGSGELAAIDLGISSADAVALQIVAKGAVVPTAPTIGIATPANGSVTVNFTAPNNVGRLALSTYTATCGAQSATGASSPIVVSGLTNGNAVTCTVVASNSVGNGVASAASNSVTPSTGVAFTSAVPTATGAVGAAYSFTVTASGTPAPTFSVTAGALPTGLSLNGTTGVIGGLPSVAATFTGTVQATNGSSSDTQNFSIVISQGGQTISFPLLGDKVIGDPAFNVNATASSGLSVSFNSTTPAVCTLATNTVTIVTAGTCTIAADQAGDANYAAAPQVTRSFNVLATAPGVVISQVYGGGGNAGSVYTNDFVELFNRGSSPVDVTGWSVQYASSAGTTWTPTVLSGIIPAGGYFLVQEAAGTGGTTPLPAPNATGSIAMSGTAGKIALSNASAALTGGCPSATVVDFVGFGAAANCFEGVGPTPAPSNANSVSRLANGCTDTNANNTDFVATVAAPRNSATPVAVCSSLPSLSISDPSVTEGNAGTVTMTFTVTLSAPAGAGGVTFDIATQDGTATAGVDYVARSLFSQSIPQGSTTYTFDVTVNGDLSPEANETIKVNVTNLAGANAAKGTGTGTIINDDAGVNLSIDDVSHDEGNSGTTTYTFTASLSGPAPAGGVTFDIGTASNTATAGSDFTANVLSAQTIPAGQASYTFTVLVNGDITPELTETFFVNLTNVDNAIPVKTQGVGTIVNDDALAIHTVQGSGNASPYVGQVVTVEGIVTNVSQGANSLLGYFIQEPDATIDADPATSEGLFVFTNATPATVSAGDRVRVTGTISEFGTAPNTLTELGTPTLTPTTTVLSTGNPLPAVVTVTLPVAVQGDLERYEGMRVQLLQTLTVSDHFDLAHFGEITVTANGRAIQPTSVVDPNDNPASGTNSSGATNVPAVNAFLDLARRSSIILDGSFQTYPTTVPFLDTTTNTIRLGSTVSAVSGVLSQLGGTHRVYPDVAPVFTYAARPLAPPVVGGNVKVASANVLNYFNGDGLGGGFPTSRGANSLFEFNRQRAKVLAALVGLNADVIGLLEVENDAYGAQSAIQDIVNGMNAATAPGTWATLPPPANYGPFGGSGLIIGGSDEIRPAIVYRVAAVAPVGGSTSPNDAAFNQARAPLAQTFKLLSNDEKFTLVVNHFKSKGSGSGANADQGDGQAASNADRKAQAAALLSFINTLTPTSPRVIAMGDFNAYEEEDPLDIMRAGGLTPLISNDPSYLFDGLSGALDHALANSALLSVVTNAGHWHINADEPIFLDYNVENKNLPQCVTLPCNTPDYFTTEPFRASDHDPVLVGLNLVAAQTITFPAITSFSWSGGSATLAATASSGLTVTYGVQSGPCTLAGNVVSATAGGTCVIAANQAGNANFSAAPQVTASVTVTATAQTITFPTMAPQTFTVNGTFNVAATSSSLLTVTFTSTTTGVCTVSGTTVTMLAAGTCTIAADQAGNASYSAAPQVTQDITLTASVVTFTVTASAGANGSIAPSGIQSVISGATTSFTVTPDASYGATVGGTCGGVLSGTTYTTNAVTADCTVTASFTQIAMFGAKSRKMHGAIVGDLNVAMAGPITVEPRMIGPAHVIVFNLTQPITAAGTATVRDPNFNVIPGVQATTSASGNDVIVTITGLADNQRVNIAVAGVNGAVGTFEVDMGFLVGDVNSTGSVNAADISAMRARLNTVTNASNFRFDLGATGSVRDVDVSATKARSGMVLP
ncbi:MAG: ExeM/NucH family extracellular endonuclease [Betaproteobacteria bacterium]